MLSVAKTGASKRKANANFKKLNDKGCNKNVSYINVHTPVFHRGEYLQIEDVVSVADSQNEELYFAQIQLILQNDLRECFVILRWLIPMCDYNEFRPGYFKQGPIESVLRRIECVGFVCHNPWQPEVLTTNEKSTF